MNDKLGTLIMTVLFALFIVAIYYCAQEKPAQHHENYFGELIK